MKTIEFWLVRHGQTEENVKKVLCGQQGGTLTQIGIKQAESLGKRLSNEKFDFIYVSDLARTRHTFECIQKQLNNKAPVEYTNLIMEKNAGILDGQSLDVPKQLAAQQNIPFREYRPEKGESWIDVMERSKQFLIKIVSKHLITDQQFEKVLLQDEQIQQQQVQQQPPLKLVTRNSLQNNYNQNKQSVPMQVQGLMIQEKIKSTTPSKIKKIKIIKLLGVSHGGFIMEIQNFIKFLMTKKEPVYSNDSVNCSITIFEISLKQQPNDLDNIIECLDIKVTLKNDNKHCRHIK